MSTQIPLVTIPNTEVRILQSANVDQEYRIFVALPHGYADTDEAYPVLYVLDADFYFGMVTEAVRFLPRPSSPHKMIVVGIGYPVNNSIATMGFRTRDCTPTESDKDERWYQDIRKVVPELPEYEGSGGAPNFLRFTRQELVPFINSNYRADCGDQTIFGHSFCGLLALYVLFREPDAFDRYIIGSPSIWWDEGITFTYEADFAASNSDLSATVFMAVGALEPDDPENLMVTNVRKMAATLQNRNYENLELTTHIFEDETHFSVIPPTISRGLRVLFG